MADGDLCRAYGSTVLLILTGNDTATVRHNTLAGEGDAQIAYGEGTSTDKIYIQNNMVVGFPYYASTSVADLSAAAAPRRPRASRATWAGRSATCPTGTHLQPRIRS